MANLSQIKLPNGTTYNIKDNGALQLTGGQVTGPVTFGDSVSIDEAILGDLVVNGSASFTNNIQANTINGVVVGSSPKFTDTPMTVTTTGSGNVISAISASGTTITATKGATVPTNWLNGSATGSVRTIYSQAEDSNYTIGQYAVAEGAGTKASGQGAHAECGGTTASGNYSHAEGGGTNAIGDYSHTEGGGTRASSSNAHAEGNATTASGNSSHAEGGNTTASGISSHAEGSGTKATGDYSHTEGSGTTASGSSSHAEGNYTIANHYAQHVFGEWNIADSSSNAVTERGNYVEIVGNGTALSRSNARTLDWSGNEVLAGKLTVGAVGTNSMDVATVGQIPTITLNGAANTSPSFYAPTTAGTNGYVLKSNGSGAPTWTNATLTDTKVTTAALTSGATYYPILATGTGTATRQIDSTLRGFTYKSTAGTASVVGSAVLTLGNNTSSGTANNEEGILRLYGKNTYYTTLKTDVSGADKEILLPNKTGTIAITDDLIDSTIGISSETQAEFSSGFLVSPDTLAEALIQIDDGFLDIWQVATTSRMGMMSSTDKIYLNGLSEAIGTTSSTITIKNGSSGGRAFYLETSSSDTDDTSLISAITALGWDSDVIVS